MPFNEDIDLLKLNNEAKALETKIIQGDHSLIKEFDLLLEKIKTVKLSKMSKEDREQLYILSKAFHERNGIILK